MKAIDNFEEFLLCDLPSKIFPKTEVNGEVWCREDYFKNKDEVKKYIEELFEVFRKELMNTGKAEVEE